MIKRTYFMGAKCTEGDGYCFVSQVTTVSCIFASQEVVFDFLTDQLKEKLVQIRTN